MSARRDTETLRAGRIELVDGKGRVRMALGRLERHEGCEGAFGVAVLGSRGNVRVWLALEPTGPALVFDLGGNNLLHLGVHDPRPYEEDGAFVHLNDGDGMPVFSVRVAADGTLIIHRHEEV